MPRLKLADAEIEYDQTGEGEPLVLIPGFASGAWSWAWQIPDLSKQFSVITFDPRGVGRSTFTRGDPIRIATLADDVAALMSEIGIEAAQILGISFGGFVAQELALRYARRVKGLVLASTSFGGANHVMPDSEVMSAFASTQEMNSTDRIRRHIVSAFTAEFADSNPDAVEEFCRLREENPVPEQVYLDQLQAAMGFDAESRVPMIAARTLVLTGDSDTVVPAQNSKNLATTIPNAMLGVIAGAGHMAFVEKAAEFNQFVADFLNSNN